ncbi:TPM domain-containing protein [Candidatus Omnitrophota bacterium]
MKYKKIFFIAAAGAALFLYSVDFASADSPWYPERPQGYVNDYARALDAKDGSAISSLAYELDEKTGAQLAVVTVNSTKPETIEGYAVTLFERWGIGRKGKDSGVLLLIAVQDRKLRIEPGYGLEGALPDAVCDRIIRDTIVPYFKSGRYSEGILRGSAAIVSVIANEYKVEISGSAALRTPAAPPKKTPLQSILHFLFTLVIFIIFLQLRMGLFGLLLLGSGRRRGGYWYGGGVGGSSGGFGGGFGGFGGGFSGGGGSSGGW